MSKTVARKSRAQSAVAPEQSLSIPEAHGTKLIVGKPGEHFEPATVFSLPDSLNDAFQVDVIHNKPSQAAWELRNFNYVMLQHAKATGKAPALWAMIVVDFNKSRLQELEDSIATKA